MKKRSERCKHCALAVAREPKKFALPQTPFPGAQDGQNLISWRWSLPLPKNPVLWRSMHTISSYHGNRPKNTQTNPQTKKLITIHCTAASVQCNNYWPWMSESTEWTRSRFKSVVGLLTGVTDPEWLSTSTSGVWLRFGYTRQQAKQQFSSQQHQCCWTKNKNVHPEIKCI